MDMDYDFSGWATVNNTLCTDGRTILKDAFADQDGTEVPLVWSHDHNSPEKVLGHAVLQNRPEGVYAYCYLNKDTDAGKQTKSLVEHGDIKSLSIWANGLKQKGKNVIHGVIRELSVCLAGANPGAVIDNVIAHADEDGEALVIYGGGNILMHNDEYEVDVEDDDTYSDGGYEDYEDEYDDSDYDEYDDSDYDEYDDSDYDYDEYEDSFEYDDFEHSAMDLDDEYIEHAINPDRTVADVLSSLDEDQKYVVNYLLNEATIGGDTMRHNVFESNDVFDEGISEMLSHDAMQEIMNDAVNYGSLKNAVIAHADSYGIDDIDLLFPDYRAVSETPEFIQRKIEWVSKLLGGTKHLPFTKIKSLFADITADEARAKGYIKGNRKEEEVFNILKRQTGPTTVYKKQKLDRDDIVDITSFDVVAWLRMEMRMMLEEEIARAVLVGDGRSTMSPDKIREDCVRPIWTDDELFTLRHTISVASSATDEAKAKAFIKNVIKTRKEYRGSGSITAFMTEDLLADMLLIEDGMGRQIYDSVEKLTKVLRVKEIVTVPVLEGLSRQEDGATKYLAAILVDLSDYSMGTDKGGSVNTWDDFDIDFNQFKYLMETRFSGCLTKPFSAMVYEFAYNAVISVSPEDPTTSMFGKLVSELQDGVIVNNNGLVGTLKYVTDYTGYSGDPALQSGNYLALKFGDSADAVTKIKLIGGDGGEVTLDADKNAVLRIKNKNQKLQVTTTVDGVTISKTLALTGLKLETAE